LPHLVVQRAFLTGSRFGSGFRDSGGIGRWGRIAIRTGTKDQSEGNDESALQTHGGNPAMESCHDTGFTRQAQGSRPKFLS
jgi:hypothetical protein